MTILCSRFVNPPQGSQEYNALLKAVEEEPRVVLIGRVDGVDWYQVNSTRELDVAYPVRVWEDNDREVMERHDVEERDGQLVLTEPELVTSENGQFWIECFCPAATPYFDYSKRDLICWLPKSCYHMGAILIYVARQI